MKGKLAIVLLLVAFLVFTVRQMMQYENEIREDHIIRLYVKDESKPLLEKVSETKLKEIIKGISYNFKAENTYFKSLDKNAPSQNDASWNSIFLKGVNLGVAIPGKFPAEFALSFDEYLEWLELIGKMNANVIRIYTIFPPEFYKAFAFYNLQNSDKPLYLMHGVWATVPEDKDYFNAHYMRDFQKEIMDVIDVVHGKAVLEEHPGKAHGVYPTDISDYVIGFLLGREWEPKSVYYTIQKNAVFHFDGDFVNINDGNAMEVWLAQMMNFTTLYETQTYTQQHPISFVNWLPLDPMYHSTEFIENEKVREYDNDLISLDFEKFNTGPFFHAGIYAAYHVYPYYPDFIDLQKNYVNAINELGQKDNYFGYLTDLKNHTKGMPLVIAEYGLPSSRGLSHFTPSGYHQGGHSEAQQAKLSLQLTKGIYETDCAGAIYFEWADEWFKHNWLVMDFEVPFEDRKLWHNMENPEQNFGIVALESKPPIFEQKNKSLATFADPTYFHISAHLPNFDFGKNNLYLAIDTYDKEKGDHRLPFSEKYFSNGFEFLCSFKSHDDAKIQVDEPYAVYTDIYNDYVPVYASQKNQNGAFIDQLLLTNRGRETLMGELSDSMVFNRSPLVFGDASIPEFSNADWNWIDSTDILKLRLDWHLLNVTDPAKKMVLDDIEGTRDIEATQTQGFNMYLIVTDKQNKIISQFPEDNPFFATWDEWETPEFTQRIKPIYDTLKNYFFELYPKDVKGFPTQIKESFSLADYYNDKKGVISISFDNAMYSQYTMAYPILRKYKMNASYSITPEIIKNVVTSIHKDDENVSFKAMGLAEIKELKARGNSLSWQFHKQSDTSILKQVNFELPESIHVHDGHYNHMPDNVIFVRESAHDEIRTKQYDGVNYTLMPLHFNQIQLDSILKKQKNHWSIFVYHHLYEDTTDVARLQSMANIPMVQRDTFEKQIRLMRNTDYLITSEIHAFKYNKEKQASKIVVNQFGNSTFLLVKNNLDKHIFNHPLTLKYKTSARKIKVLGSFRDGIYENRTGEILINVYPNKEVKLEVLE